MRFKVGTKVQVDGVSGLNSDCKGTIIPKHQVPTDHDGVPKLPDGGHYKPMRKDEVAIMGEDGRIFTMFKNRLKIIE